MIIVGQECEDCIYATVDDHDKSRVIVYCDAKDKKYYWGTCIPCELKKKKEVLEDG